MLLLVRPKPTRTSCQRRRQSSTSRSIHFCWQLEALGKTCVREQTYNLQLFQVRNETLHGGRGWFKILKFVFHLLLSVLIMPPFHHMQGFFQHSFDTAMFSFARVKSMRASLCAQPQTEHFLIQDYSNMIKEWTIFCLFALSLISLQTGINNTRKSFTEIFWTHEIQTTCFCWYGWWLVVLV